MLFYQNSVLDIGEKQGEFDQCIDGAKNDRGVQGGVGAGEATSSWDYWELYGGGNFEVLVAIDFAD